MKLKLQRETLLKPLQLVIGVVERKQTLPILSNILLKIRDKKLSITGTDLEVELIGQTELDASPEENELTLTLPGRKLMDICRALPDNAPIELLLDKEKVVLKSGRSRFTLSTLPAEDFPSVDQKEGNLTFSLPQQDLRQLLQRTHFAMAQQDVRYYLNGLLIEVCADRIQAVATDGHRLATSTIDLKTQSKHRMQVIIPRKGVLELLRLLEETEEPVEITIGNNHIHASAEHFTFTSKLVEGRFPDYDRVIPKDGNKVVSIERDTLRQALSRSAILCNEKFRGVRFELRNNLLRILANNPQQEAAEEELEINYSKEDLTIGFNVNYLLDILNTLKTGLVNLTFSDSNSSVLLQEIENTDSSAFVVMPMRL